MTNLPIAIKITISLITCFLVSSSVMTQDIGKAYCQVRLIYSVDIRKNLVIKTNNEDSNTYVANGSLFILLDPPTFSDRDSVQESPKGSHIQLTIYSSLENGQDINISLTGDSSYFVNQQGGILLKADTSFAGDENSSAALINFPLNVSGEVFLKNQDKPGGSPTYAPLLIRIDYY